MTDEFQTFDKSSLGQLIGAKRWGIGAREFVAIVISLCLVLLCVIFVGLYAGYNPPQNKKEVCVSRECMYVAAHATELMNRSVDPCDDFYQYACGNYKTYNPRKGRRSRSIIDDMYNVNVDRLLSIITERPSWFSLKGQSHQKLINLYSSCMDVHTRETLAGRPLVKLLDKVGGMYLLGTWNQSQWDFQTTLKEAQRLWIPVFFDPWLAVNPDNHKKRLISLTISRPEIMYSNGFTSAWYQHEKKYYTTFVQRVAKLIIRDAANPKGLAQNETDFRLSQFVNDTVAMATKMAEIQNKAFRDSSGSTTVSDLNSASGNSIDWIKLLSNLYKSPVTEYDDVVLRGKTGVMDVLAMIKSVLAQPDGKRMLHNYVHWRVVESTLRLLSQDYEQADHDLHKYIHGRGRNVMPRYLCLLHSYAIMYDAVNAIFVQSHAQDGSKHKATDITGTLKTSLQERLDKASWLDTRTRSYAKDKLDKVIYKIGHPDWMDDRKSMDLKYRDLSIKSQTYFENMQNGAKFIRNRYIKQYKQGSDNQRWNFPIYVPKIAVYYGWNDMTVTSGILQDPFWSQDAPHYMTFGTLGSAIGRKLVDIISDSRGSVTSSEGKYKKWWSQSATKRYKAIKTCIGTQYQNVTKLKMYSWLKSAPAPQKVFSLTSGIRAALTGLKDWTRLDGAEKGLAGLDMTPNQLFFLSFAQGHCHNMDWWEALFVRSGYNDQVADMQVNMALGQIPEFSDAFRCPAGSKMNHKTKCSYL